ncbi:AraC family transcriptional regulator [Sporolactobacillus shoreicorticis]|uniref:AraC family transcriptional regulator n=1 Tax=Sporolactobacillus shoreicorticis TaxID=1923877 RepID=A0ABW5S7R2_9BACL|nr:AraC family transcriptional regulator [Sporolactobacillus shoreicorticis]MCO7126881.1 AraC family transcriptional regulator [Sporolactobacillus shoreicorticis]
MISYQADLAKSIEMKTCANEIHTSRTHFHDEVSIGLIEKGSCRTEINHHAFTLSARTLLVIPSGTVHHCQPIDVKNWCFKMVYIRESWFTKISDGRICNGSIYSKLKPDTFDYILNTFKQLEERLMYGEMVSSPLIELMDVMDWQEHSSMKQGPKTEISEKIIEIKQYLSKNYLNKITLENLSELAGINKYQLIRRFYSYTGLTPQKYLINLRINAAKKKLQNHEAIIGVAAASRFYDQSHFDKYFKAYTGVSPMRYCSN